MDQGKSFENQLIRELCSLAQVQKLCTMPYRPQTNGSCERFNYTLMSMLGTLPVHAKRNWPEWVSTLTMPIMLRCAMLWDFHHSSLCMVGYPFYQ